MRTGYKHIARLKKKNTVLYWGFASLCAHMLILVYMVNSFCLLSTMERLWEYIVLKLRFAPQICKVKFGQQAGNTRLKCLLLSE